VKASDLIIAIGPRLGEMTTGGYTLLKRRAKQKLVHIHASAEELNRVYQADLAINATMNAAARSLEVLTAPVTVPWEAWTAIGERRLSGICNHGSANLPGDIDMPAIVACCKSTCRPMRC
jgi:acetolactate synthase-1/2/3 large subunit